MVTYPIHVPRARYRGSKENLHRKNHEQNRLVAELEDYLNRKIEKSDDETQTFLYAYIAADTHIPEESVRRILFAVDGGHNGLTVRKPQDK